MVSLWENGEVQDALTYIDVEGNELTASLGLVSQMDKEEEAEFLASAGEKLPLVFYGIAMEYHAMKYYDQAERNLDIAYLISSPENETPYRNMVVELTANVHSERVNMLLGRGNVLFRF